MPCRRFAIILVALMPLAVPAQGATIEVSDQCTIEQAILAANTDSKQTNSNCPAGSGFDTILLPRKRLPFLKPKKPLEIIGSLRIVGRGQDKTIIDGQGGSFGFIQVGSTGRSGSVSLEGLTIMQFQPTRDGGQAPLSVLEGSRLDLSSVTIKDNGDADTLIGAIITSGYVSVIASTIRNNGALRSTIFVNHMGHLSLSISAVVENTVKLTDATIVSLGETRIENSTISDNKGLPLGIGGISVGPEGKVHILNSTIAFNQGRSTGGLFNNPAGTVTLQNSILANNSAVVLDPDDPTKQDFIKSNCIGEVKSGGYNLFDHVLGEGCQIKGGSQFDQFDEPRLDSTLRTLGATTLMHRLLPGSPAIDMGVPFTQTEPRCPRFDQRGIRRFGRCDIGAVEAGAALLVFDPDRDYEGDMAMKDHIEQDLGFVTFRDTLKKEEPPQVAGKNLVIISDSAPSMEAGQRFRDVPVPVVVTQPGVFGGMLMTGAGPGDFGTSPNMTSVTIVTEAETRFTAAGLKGTITTTKNKHDYAHARKLATGAKCTAKAAATSGRCMLFSIGKGQALFNNMRSPARRLGFFAMRDSFSDLTTEGWRLFDAAVLWAAQGESQ